MAPTTVPAVALRDHAARLRATAGLDEAPIVSAAGLWLLLAAVAETVTEPADRAAVEDVLGVPVATATLSLIHI